jgi:hypothetical protein
MEIPNALNSICHRNATIFSSHDSNLYIVAALIKKFGTQSYSRTSEYKHVYVLVQVGALEELVLA